MADLAALLGDRAAVPLSTSKAVSDKPAEGERRAKLRRYEHPAALTLQPFGKSSMQDCSLVSLCEAVKAGKP